MFTLRGILLSSKRSCFYVFKEFEYNFPLKSLFCTGKMFVSTSGKPTQVYVTRRVPGRSVSILRSEGYTVTQWDSDNPVSREDLLRNVKGIDGLFCLLTDRIDEELIDAAGNQLKVIATMSVGYDHIDVKSCRSRGIKLGHTPDVLTHATAELTVSLLLATSRRIAEGIEAVKDGLWGTWKPSWLCGPSLQRSTVGIFGFGRIGQQVMHMLSGFGVGQFIYCSRGDVNHPGAEKVSFDDLLSQSDFLIICCSLNSSTNGLFSKSSLARMKRTAILINTSRGAVVDMNDLADALENQVILAAGLDVTVPEPLSVDHRLLKLKNCVVLPHIGSATNESREAMSELTAYNIISALKGQSMPAEIH